jgi:hypothetical protein
MTALADDLLEEADAIAAFIYGTKEKKRRVYHLAKSSGLPVFKMGGKLCARKSALLAWVAAQERAVEKAA